MNELIRPPDDCTCLWVSNQFAWFDAPNNEQVTLPTHGEVYRADKDCPVAPHAQEWNYNERA